MNEPRHGDKSYCAVCQDDDELLIACDDGKSRCPPCCVDSGWCIGCGSKIGKTGDPILGLCFYCRPIEPDEWKANDEWT